MVSKEEMDRVRAAAMKRAAEGNWDAAMGIMQVGKAVEAGDDESSTDNDD